MVSSKKRSHGFRLMEPLNSIVNTLIQDEAKRPMGKGKGHRRKPSEVIKDIMAALVDYCERHPNDGLELPSERCIEGRLTRAKVACDVAAGIRVKIPGHKVMLRKTADRMLAMEKAAHEGGAEAPEPSEDMRPGSKVTLGVLRANDVCLFPKSQEEYTVMGDTLQDGKLVHCHSRHSGHVWPEESTEVTIVSLTPRKKAPSASAKSVNEPDKSLDRSNKSAEVPVGTLHLGSTFLRKDNKRPLMVTEGVSVATAGVLRRRCLSIGTGSAFVFVLDHELVTPISVEEATDIAYKLDNPPPPPPRFGVEDEFYIDLVEGAHDSLKRLKRFGHLEREQAKAFGRDLLFDYKKHRKPVHVLVSIGRWEFDSEGNPVYLEKENGR